MQNSMSIEDLGEKLRTILESQKTTVSLDTNIYKPFYNISVPGLDLTKLPTPILNGYDIPALIIKQRLYNKETAKAARYIQASNAAYTHLLSDFFEKYPNLVLPAQVKEELENWIESANIEGYEKWIEGEKRPFNLEAADNLIRIRQKNPDFAPIFNIQHEYKKAVKKFLESIDNKKIVDYETDMRLAEIVEKLNKVEAGDTDKKIFRNSYLATSDNGDKTLKIVSFDGGMIRIAKEFDKRGLGKGIELHVHNGYSQARYDKAKEPVFLRFNQVYPKVKRYQAA